MAKVNSVDEIESVFVHWSESNLINDELGCDDECDINKLVDPAAFNDLVSRAAKQVGSGYDKTVLTIKLKSGIIWANDVKFYLNAKDESMLTMINRGE